MIERAMTEPPPPSTIAVWTPLIRAGSHVQTRIEAALQAESLPPLAWYDALWEVEKAGRDGIRPFALQELLLLPQYGLSRLTLRLVKAGYVERRACDGDGRGQLVHLTPDRAAVRARMWPVYAGALGSAVTEKLPAAEAPDLTRLLARLMA